MFKLNDTVKSKVTGKEGIIQATYDNGKFMLYHGTGYEYLNPDQMEHIPVSEVPFRVDLYMIKA